MRQKAALLFAKYLECSDLRDSTVQVKSRAFRYFVRVVGDLPVEDVTYCHAEDYRNFLSKGRSKSSANTYVQVLSPFFGWLVKRGLRRTNPFDNLPLFKIGERKKVVFQSDEILRILTVATDRWKAIVLLALCSLRRAEILNLTNSEIHYDKDYILISPKKDGPRTWAWEIKNHNQAIVPLPVFIMDYNLHRLLQELTESQPYVILPPEYYRKLIALKSAGGLDWEKRNTPWLGNFTRQFNNLLRRASVPPKEFRSLRTTFATVMARNGCTLSETQKLMRHSSPNTTARYYICIDDEKLVKKSNRIAENYYSTNVP